MSAKNHYDAVLVGLDLSILLAGALLAKRGFRVLLLGQGQPWPSYELAGVRFPRAPFALAPADSPACARCFSELALKPLVQRRTRRLSPAFQAVLPRRRIDFGRDVQAFGRELERELPSARRFAEELWQEIGENSARLDRLIERDLMWPPQGFFERREFARALSATPLDDTTSHARASARFEGPARTAQRDGAEPFSRILEACVRTLDPSASEPGFTPRTLRLLRARLDQAALGEGGLTGLYELLIENIRTHNGSLRLNERVVGLSVRRGALESLHLSPSDEEIGCHFLLWGLPIGRLAALLPDREELAPHFAEVGEPRALGSRFTLNLLLRAEALPEGMGRNVLLLQSTGLDASERALWLEAERLEDGERAILSCESWLPVRDADERAQMLASQRERMLDALALLSPFLREHVQLIDSPHDGRPAQDARSGAALNPDPSLRRGPETMEPVYAFPSARLHGAAALGVRTPIKRVLLCNTQVVPGLGQEGTFLTAWSAARAVTRALNRDWMKRGRWTKVEL